MRTICKNPQCPRGGKPFTHKRAGRQYCSIRCRVAAHRKHHARLPRTWWLGKEPRLSIRSRSFNSDGSPALSNAELGKRLIEITREGDGGKPKTGRRFFYLALSYGYILPDMGASDAAKKARDKAYKRITDILGTLRKQSEIGWGDVLDLTRELDTRLTYDSPRDARATMRRIYDEDRWRGQPYYPILVVEKDTLEPVCQPMARRWQMPFASLRGYSSLTLQHDVAEMLNRRFAKTGQWARVYFVSDHDPSGFDLQRAWEQAFEDFGVLFEPFVRLALTTEQVRDSALDIERLSIDVKPSDSRSRGYIARYGDRCWEADILPGDVIEQAIDADIRSWLDTELWDRREREIDRARALL